MKKIIIYIICAAAAVIVAGCAKMVTNGQNEANQRYFKAWMEINHPNARPTGLGIYILEETQGTGIDVKDGGYVMIDYTKTDLEGNILSYTSAEVAKQLGEYGVANYYGPQYQATAKGTALAGLSEAFSGMKVGGSRKVIIPTWLMSYEDYDTEEEYLKQSSSNESAIYEFTVTAYTEDIFVYQKEQIEEYFKANKNIFGNKTLNDTVSGHSGFYYQQTKAPIDTTSFKTDTTIYINYTGKLLNGQVFDTTNERLAKDMGIWSSTRNYAPVSIKWGEDYSDITLSGSTVITGFALTLWQMRAFESGVGVFTSDYGYGVSGSGHSIPPYAPLIFEIEIVAKPE